MRVRAGLGEPRPLASVLSTFTKHSALNYAVDYTGSGIIRTMGAVFARIAIVAAATTLLASCGQAEPTGTDGPEPTSEPQSGPASTPAPTPTPAARFPGFDLEVTQDTFWEYRWSYTQRSCAQGSGCSTKEDEGLYRVTLGPPREIQGVTAYEIQLTGKHKVALPDVTRDFAPRWEYLAVSDNGIHGSLGSGLTVIFDGQLGKWAGSGYFTDRFSADELIEANRSSITQDAAIADWPGVRTGGAISIGRASSQSQCEIIAGIRVCPQEETLNVSEREMYREGVGPVAYLFQSSASFSGGGFFSSFQTTENVRLVASSLRGDTASALDEVPDLDGLEVEPNNSLEQAQSLSLPDMIMGDIFHSDARAELRFYDSEAGEWKFLELQDMYRFTVSDQRGLAITLSSEGGTSADLNLLLLTPSETTSEDTLFIDGKETELVDLSTADDPVETISTTLSPGEYFIDIQAFLTRARTDYVLTIE